MELNTIGIDLGKTVFALVGLNQLGQVVLRKKFSRKQPLHFTANLRVDLIGMEACGEAHFLGRALREQGHEVRRMPAQYVKPYVKTDKNDYIDAEAIAEAGGRPKMRVVPNFLIANSPDVILGPVGQFSENRYKFERMLLVLVRTTSISMYRSYFRAGEHSNGNHAS
jgi:transposase